MNRLMLGAGGYRRDGWKTLDVDRRKEPDFVCELPNLTPEVKAIQWDQIEWIHGITSLTRWDAETVLVELRKILAPGGKLVLEQPNFLRAMESRRPDWLFGDPSLKNPFHMNHWSYAPEELLGMLKAAGFRRAEILPAIHHVPDRDFRVEAFA